MGTKNKVSKKLSKKSSGVKENTEEIMPKSSLKPNPGGHVEQLKRLQEKDPEFYQFLQEHDKELLEFDDEDIDDDADTEMDGDEIEDDDEADEFDSEQLVHADGKEVKSSTNVITSAMVDSWCNSIHENRSSGAIRSLMRAFRTACHYGDDTGEDAKSKWSTMSSAVFNKIMLFVLKEMDGILRGLLKLPTSGGKKEMIKDMCNTKRWKSNNHLVKSYLGNALHVLNQMTDTEMISFTLRRLRFSSLFLAAFPVLLRKYIKVLLHFWGTGGGALPVVSFLFLRDLCMQLGSDCIDECFRGMYKAYLLNCQFVNAAKLQHIQFLGNCFVELLRADLPNAYQHAFVFIRQLAMILREAHSGGTKTKKSSQKANQSSKEAHNTKAKDSFLKVYQWKYIHCLELWTAAICAYSSEPDFMPLAYPLTQIISGAARLVPTVRYFPLRLRCVRMLNRIAASTNSFVPVSPLLLDMLEIKELHRPPTGGVGKAVDFRTSLRVSKLTLKTRAFQETCVFSVVEELAEHLAQWSYSVAFFELSFVPVVRLREFCKSTNVERFRREIRQFIRQIEANSEYINKKRMTVSFLPNDPAAASFLEDDKNAGLSPLSKYVAALRQRAQQRTDSLKESSVLVGQNSAVFGSTIPESDEDDDEDGRGDAAFSSSWLPAGNPKAEESTEEKQKKKKRRKELQDETAFDEDIVQDLILSSDEDEEGSMTDAPSDDEDSIKQKPSVELSKKKGKSRGKNKKRKRPNRVASAV